VSTAQRSHLFSQVNDRIYDLLELAEPDLPGEFLCECGGRDCERRIVLLPEAFAALRRGGEIVRSPECRGPWFGLRVRRSRSAAGVAA
jgi:hypothetical protein